ncbi:MAG: CinA family protein [Candidatus Coproplasma sp.]
MSSSQDIKLCLLSLESKRILNFNTLQSACESLASIGYYCDKVCKVAYDNSNEIVHSFKDALDNYSNVVIFCPQSMCSAVMKYFSSQCGTNFDSLGMLTTETHSIFLFNSDCANRLTWSDVKSHLDNKYSVKFDRVYIRACAPMDVVEKTLAKASEECNLSELNANFNVKYDCGDCRIEILYTSSTPKIYLDELVRMVVDCLGEYVYALEDITLAEQLYRLLKLRRMKISIAESFTGGGVGKKLVEVPGVSEVYFEGLNTYANEAKTYRLGVKELTLKQYGAVSAETAYEMAEGLLNTGNCDIAVATTGIAGPKSDNTSKPVGLAYIAVGVVDDIEVFKFNFGGDRENITKCGINQALYLTYKKLK